MISGIFSGMFFGYISRIYSSGMFFIYLLKAFLIKENVFPQREMHY